jgi:Asp-tRNA(Asn)/Glu-tRNA(Gln) amidotransferase A subunit family amidase
VHAAFLVLPVRLAQVGLEDLPRRVAWEHVGPVDRRRALVVREPFPAESHQLVCGARAAARDADDRRAAGDGHSRFLGVPISIKDLADTAGIVSTHGTAEWRNRVDDYDLFVSPTLALPPPAVGSMSGAGIEDMLRFLALTPFTALWNTTG